MIDLTTLRRGDGIVIRIGSRGTQYALVVSVAADGRSARVRKWLARGARWTDRRTVYPVQVLRRAQLGEYRPSKPWPEACT